MSSLLEFLDHILPQSGHRCWFVVRNKKPKQGFSSSNEDLSKVLAYADMNGCDVYMGCASFKDPSVPKPRSKPNVAMVRSFWLDLDAGAGKGYIDHDEAIGDTARFCASSGLPTPTIVKSGNGIHLWWTMDRDITPEEWEAGAAALRKTTDLYALDVDNSRTTDRASILRPITTHNYKDITNPKEVSLHGYLQPTISYDTFIRSVKGAGLFGDGLSDVASAARGGLTDNFPSIPSNATLAATRCSQLGHFKAVCGRLPEPLWYACLGVLAHCSDGELVSQQWSSGHPSYSEVETTRKFEHARTASGPTTCAKFRSLNPDGCKGCPHNITSPIQLGKNEDLVIPPKIEVEEKKLKLPEGFRWGNNYEIMCKVRNPDPDGEPKFIDKVLCHFPFQIESIREVESDETIGDKSVKISTRTPHTKWKHFVVDQSILYGQGWIAALASKGVTCVPGMEKQFRMLVAEMITGMEKMQKPDVCYASFGWKDDRSAFIIGRHKYTKQGIFPASGTDEFERIASKLRPSKKGSFNEWRGLANKLFAPGCEPQAFALLCSFAAPLMDLLYAGDEGGSILSLVSHGSGRGKTTALAAAESVWGESNCVRMTETSSIAAKFRAIGIRKNLPVTTDEWGDNDPDVTYKLVTTFTGGLDKDRLTQQGKSINERLTWKTIWIGSTNRPIVDQLRNANYHPQANRIFEIPVSIPDAIARKHSSEMNKGFELHCGFAGPCFITHLFKHYDLDQLQKKALDLVDAFGKHLQVQNDFRFAIRIVAAVAIVAKIVAEDKIGGEPMLEFNPKRIVRWALEHIKSCSESGEAKISATAHLTNFIIDNMYDFVVVDRPYNPNKPPAMPINRPKKGLKGRYEKEPKKLYIPSDLMRKHALLVKIPYKEFVAELYEKGIVIQKSRPTLLSAGVHEMTDVLATCWEVDLNHPHMGDIIKETDTVENNVLAPQEIPEW